MTGYEGGYASPSAAVGVSSLGNTAGNTGLTNFGSYVLSGGDNVTLSQITGAGIATIRIDAASGGAGGGVALSAGTQLATSGTVSFLDASGITWGLDAGTLTASVRTDYQSAGAYLTTAMVSGAGTRFVQASATIAGTSISGTIASDGLSLSVGPYLTTAALSGDTTKYAGVGETVGTIAGTDLALTVNTLGVSIQYPKWITTAALSGDTTKYAGVGESSGTVAGTDINFTMDTAGLSLLYPKVLTTARASTDALGLNTAGTNMTWTANSSGLSINAGGYAGTNTAITGNASITLNSSILSFNGSGLAGTVTGATGGSLTANSSGISMNVPAQATLSMWPDVLPGSTAVSTYYSGSTSQGAGGGSTRTGYTFSLYAVPMPLPAAVAFSELRQGISLNSAAGTGSVTHVWSVGIYSNNASTLSRAVQFYAALYYSQNSQTSNTFRFGTVSTGSLASAAGGFGGLSTASVFSRAANNMSSDSQYYGRMQWLRFGTGASTSLSAGQYYYVFGHCSVSGNANVLSCVGFLQSNAIQSIAIPDFGNENSTQSSNYLPAWGAISTTFTSASDTATWFPLPNAINIANMSLSSSDWYRFHFLHLRNNS